MKINFTKLILIFILLGGNITLSAQTWSKSFTAGNLDTNNTFLGGSEILQMVAHKNKLFASVGYWQDGNNIWYGGTNINLGWSQIIRLDNADSQWQEDHFLGTSYLRPEILKQVIFTKDASGNTLSEPDTLLIAAGYSPNFLTSTVTATAFTRNDNNGTWDETQIFQGGLPAGENYSIRDIQIYTDQTTGTERIYASVGTKGIFAGKYNPAIPGKIAWIPSSETGPLAIRPLGICEANNSLYFSSGSKLYKRNDGTTPSYTVAHDFSDLSSNINSAVGGIRGLTTIENPNGNNEALLLMWCPNGQSKGIVYRLEPDGNGGFERIYESKFSQLVEDYLPGSSVSYLLGAYNEFYEYVDPLTSETVHLIGFEANISGGGHPLWNGYYKGALFAKRGADMTYSVEEINGEIGVNDTALVANRCYVKSPFLNENALYFGGFDPNGFAATSMAWIFKKDYQTTATNEASVRASGLHVYPNPAQNHLVVETAGRLISSCEVYHLMGKRALVTEDTSVDLRSLSKGAYVLTVVYSNGERENVKFVKR